ncbi:MAG: hypothetical protein FWD34_08145 [Oscillospiraceae bacterium]|nr:hypothetical protein [Oscillospiraceae bacterium]
MDLRTFFIFAETLLKNEQELRELEEKQRHIEIERKAAEKEIPILEKAIKEQVDKIKEEAKSSVAKYEKEVDYKNLQDWITDNMSSFERTCAPVLQALLDDSYSSIDRATVLATMYPEIFTRYLQAKLNETSTPLTDLVSDKNDMVRDQLELEKKLNQLSLSLTDLKKRIPKVESAYNFPLKQTLEMVSLAELEAWENVMPLIKKYKLAALDADKATKVDDALEEAAKAAESIIEDDLVTA